MASIEEIEFYKESLSNTDIAIKNKIESGKALKDIIGEEYEKHRKRLWEYFGFQVSKEKHEALFDIDWCISYNGIIIAFEEDKGHYLDSCFLERAITGFSKTVNSYLKIKKEVPVLILHSFTTYSKFNEKLNDDLDTRKEEIVMEMKKKMFYTTLVNRDRLSKKSWFPTAENCYINNACEELIKKDIKFIKSLIPSSAKDENPESEV